MYIYGIYDVLKKVRPEDHSKLFARYKVARTQYQSPIWSQDVLACTQIGENQLGVGHISQRSFCWM